MHRECDLKSENAPSLLQKERVRRRGKSAGETPEKKDNAVLLKRIKNENERVQSKR